MRKNCSINAQKNGVRDVEALTIGEEEKASSRLERLMPYNAEATSFTVVCRRSDYSAGRIVTAIEDCNAHVLNLNVTADVPGDDLVAVELRVDRKDIASIARSLGRYDYVVAGAENPAAVVSETDRRRVEELLRYLNI